MNEDIKGTRGSTVHRPLRIAVFASGNGSNFQAIVDAAAGGRLDANIELIVCDRPKANVLKRAEQAGINAYVFRMKDFGSREEADEEIVKRLRQKKIDLIVLAGYMKMLTNIVVEPYYGRMINVHPALLPSFPGIDSIKKAIEHGVKVTGVTVHYVDGGMDTGPIIAQQSVIVEENDTEETLAQRIHKVEHELLPKVIAWIGQGRVALDNGKVKVSSN